MNVNLTIFDVNNSIEINFRDENNDIKYENIVVLIFEKQRRYCRLTKQR